MRLRWLIFQYKQASLLAASCLNEGLCEYHRNFKATDNDTTAYEGYSSRQKYYLKKSSSWEYRKRSRALRAVTSAWQSLTTCPWSLRYSPLIHLVPVDNATTCACLRSKPDKELHRQLFLSYVTVTTRISISISFTVTISKSFLTFLPVGGLSSVYSESLRNQRHSRKEEDFYSLYFQNWKSTE